MFKTGIKNLFDPIPLLLEHSPQTNHLEIQNDEYGKITQRAQKNSIDPYIIKYPMPSANHLITGRFCGFSCLAVSPPNAMNFCQSFFYERNDFVVLLAPTPVLPYVSIVDFLTTFPLFSAQCTLQISITCLLSTTRNRTYTTIHCIHCFTSLRVYFQCSLKQLHVGCKELRTAFAISSCNHYGRQRIVPVVEVIAVLLNM